MAVNHLNLKVEAGEILVYWPNGAGKTTTIKMITGLSRPLRADLLNGLI